MKKIIVSFAFFTIATITSFAQETFNLTVNISGLSSDKGQVLVGLYDNESDFLKKQLKGEIVKVKDNKTVAIFKNVPKGEYAVSFVHDENSNNKMDTNFVGIPKEDYGCSNNAKGFMGPPKYKDAKFNLTEDKVIEIKI